MNPAVLSSNSSFAVAMLASLLIWVMFGGLFLLWIFDGRIKKEQVLHAVFASVLAWIIAQMIKGLYPTLRPFEMNGLPALTLITPSDGAFPSGHTAAAFGMAVSIWLHDKKLGMLFLFLGLLVGLGRYLGNVHFASDVVGGAAVGIITAFVVERIHLQKLLR